ncbi:2-hydroxycyclohexanecarboxyl-CoA dehydrogenase [Pusillimonas sp. T2]|uniref:SDR family NAD(P)-dependent oxidoreductase n=1 Tax=Pusillimonas sp. T2 TaxID=1548123 RepID=UPI000B9CC430|nr:SDR family oxidoreductase [Pusillimonas sp. T2]OXR50717.1 2-hydroxycyclohexanecarboxyl-CoA dehydrogenase [Pusillimonas sp. T2]
MNNGKLMGKTVVVTGAAQGIGKAYAERLASEGAQIILVDLKPEPLAEAVEDLRAKGLSAEGKVLDVSNEQDVKRFAQELGQQHPKIHGLINNAAIFSTIKLKPFWEIDASEWDRVMAVNIKGPWMLVGALLPYLRAAGSASVVNIGSDAVWMGKAGYMHYVASKAAVYGMTHAMARELGGDDIRVNTLSPGFTETNVPRETFTQAQLNGIMSAQSLKRVANTDDIVGVASFLISDDSRWLTGQTLHTTGGLLFR